MATTEVLNQEGSLTGVLTRNDTVSVGTASVNVLQTTKNRTMFAVANTSGAGQVITLHIGFGVAVAGQGIVLSAGQTYIEANGEGFICYQGVMTAIASAAGGTVSVVER